MKTICEHCRKIIFYHERSTDTTEKHDHPQQFCWGHEFVVEINYTAYPVECFTDAISTVACAYPNSVMAREWEPTGHRTYRLIVWEDATDAIGDDGETAIGQITRIDHTEVKDV